MHLYGLIIGISLIVGLNYFTKHNQIIPKNKENIFLFGLTIAMLFGARIYHVADQWSFYSQNLYLIPQTWNGGLGIYGAIIFGGIYIYFFSLLSKVSFLKILDSITPILPLCQAIGRFGNFFNHEIPTWWLEASLNLILFFILKSKALKKYSTTALYLIGYGLIRFLVEFFRNDTWNVNNFKVAQLISLFCIFSGIILANVNSSSKHQL